MPGNGEETGAPDNTVKTNPVQRRHRPLALGTMVWIATAAALVLGVLATAVFAFLASGTWPWGDTSPLNSAKWYNITRSSIATVGLIGLGGGAILAYRRQQTTERLHELDRERHAQDVATRSDAKKADLRARYATAAEQLGHAGAAVRLSGVYAMAALADDWHEARTTAQQNVCINVLCAYLRMHYVAFNPNDPTTASGEREVRLTVISVIRDHLLNPGEPNSWCDKDLVCVHFKNMLRRHDGSPVFVDPRTVWDGQRRPDEGYGDPTYDMATLLHSMWPMSTILESVDRGLTQQLLTLPSPGNDMGFVNLTSFELSIDGILELEELLCAALSQGQQTAQQTAVVKAQLSIGAANALIGWLKYSRALPTSESWLATYVAALLYLVLGPGTHSPQVER